MAAARLTPIELPDFGMPDAMPVVSPATYAQRLEALRRRAQERAFDVLVVYADREHSANLSHLTGFDPRFEEAVLFVGHSGPPLLLTGIECVGLARAAPLPMRVELHSDLSLVGMPRRNDRALNEILAAEGIIRGSRVGVVGWKAQADPGWIEAPAFLVDALRSALGDTGRVENAGGLLTDPVDGLRTTNEVEQLAAFEYAACHTSSGVKRLLFGLRPGMTEQEAVQLLRWPGTPLSAHLMLSSGPRASLGLMSPGDRVIELGDRFTTAYGLWGALDCRAGFVVQDASQLPDSIGDYVERLVAPYFEAVAAWLSALRVGQTGGALQAIIDERLGDPFFGLFLTPGHLIGLEEWLHSPIAPGSETELRSGMVLQLDIIPATGSEYFTTNIESPFALADADLRVRVAEGYPAMWQRIVARRAFMRDSLGIDLHDDVLPFSNLAAYLPPFLLSPDRAMTLRP
jgi:Xaa-Pro aminopeptidase